MIRVGKWFLMMALVISVAALGAPANATPDCWGRKVTVWGTPGRDVIEGKASGEVIHGLGGDDIISSGNTSQGPYAPDFICGGAGADTLRGSEVDETLVGGSGNDSLDAAGAAEGDLLVGGGGNDILDGGAGSIRTIASFEGAPRPVVVELEGGAGTASGHGRDTLSGIGEVIGSDFADTITGGAGRGISGRKGADAVTITPAGVPDWVAGGPGNDAITVNTSAFEGPISGGRGDDVLRGSFGDDSLLNGGPGSDRVRGRAGIDDVSGCGPGDASRDRDALKGGPGEDEISFARCLGAVEANLATGRVTIAGVVRATLAAFENLEGSSLDDVLVGDGGPNAIEDGGFVEADDDVVVGAGGDDYLVAEYGRDRVRGSGGDDFLDVTDGVSGNDRAGGGAGADGCRADPGDVVERCES
jgi:Ca2+-binding RTX toxin-like protein